MAYDPEARETGNSAMIIGIVALVLVVGGALAYFLTKSNEPVDTAPTTIVNNPRPAAPATNTVIVTPPVETNTVVVEKPVPVPVPQTRVITRDTKTTTNTTRVVPAPNTGENSSPVGRQPNVTINNNAPNNANNAGNSAVPAPDTNSASGADTLPPPAQQ